MIILFFKDNSNYSLSFQTISYSKTYFITKFIVKRPLGSGNVSEENTQEIKLEDDKHRMVKKK